MEQYSQLTISLDDSDNCSNNINDLKQILNKHNLSIEEEISAHKQLLLTLIGGSEMSEAIRSALNLLQRAGNKKAWAFSHGDDGFECTLSRLVDGRIVEEHLDPGFFDAVMNYEEEFDEDNLSPLEMFHQLEDEFEYGEEELRKAAEVGAEKYFFDKLDAWSDGLVPMEAHWDYKEKVQYVIDECP